MSRPPPVGRDHRARRHSHPPVGRAPRARRYGSTTPLKNRITAFSAAVAPSTDFHSPSSVAAPFNTACISAPVQRFTFGSHSTFVGSPSSNLTWSLAWVSLDFSANPFTEEWIYKSP